MENKLNLGNLVEQNPNSETQSAIIKMNGLNICAKAVIGNEIEFIILEKEEYIK